MTALPRASVVIPAHDEAGVIRRCLHSLVRQGDLSDVEVVVVANGCSDDTAVRAREFTGSIPRLQVVEREQAGKIGALNEGDRHATRFPRIYLDADIELQDGALLPLIETLSVDEGRVAAPRVDFRTDAGTRAVQAFYDVFRDLPYARSDLVGLGIYGLSERGRRRFGEFPEVIADDLYVQRLFDPSERVTTDLGFHVFAPLDLRNLVAVRTRVARGNAELADTDHDATSTAMATTTTSTSAALVEMLLRRPRRAASVLVYVAVTMLARQRAKHTPARWHRDTSTREDPTTPPPSVQEVAPDRPSSPVVVDGVPLDSLTEEETVAYVVREHQEGRGGIIVTPNVDILRMLRTRDHEDVKTAASVMVADGMPIVWASRVQGDPLPARVTGADLVWSLSREASRRGLRLFLLGAAPGVAERAGQAFHEASPGLEVVGALSPELGFDSDPESLQHVVDEVRAAAPDLVYVAMGFPRQERLAIVLSEQLPTTWFLGCGGALDMASGDVARAGERAQRLGGEWVHRLALEPKRMARRYLVDDAPYACGMLARSLARRLVYSR